MATYLGGLWSTDPPPASMGQNALAGWNKLMDSILGNTTNPDGTITHTTVTGSVTTIDPSIPKVGTGANQVVSQTTVPGSIADKFDNLFSGFSWSPVQDITDAADNISSSITNGVSNAVSGVGGKIIAFGLLALGAIMIFEEIA